MKKILFSLFMLASFTVAVIAQDAKKECHETTKKESCEAQKEKKACCAEKKNAKEGQSCDQKKEANTKKSCGNKK